MEMDAEIDTDTDTDKDRDTGTYTDPLNVKNARKFSLNWVEYEAPLNKFPRGIRPP